jgi:hypothetical protein|tara:strand:- start:140 stop:379 length:240 start_codon:yes stop_codon:yes gene_type:complete
MSDHDDYTIALKETNNFIDEMIDAELNAGAAYTGVLTAVLFRLLKGSTDKQDVLGILGAAMASAAAHVEMETSILSDIH